MQREVIWILCSVLCLLLWYILSIVNWTVRRKSLILESILIIPGALLCGAMLSIGSHVTLQNFDVAIGYQQLHSPIQTQHLLSVGLPIVLCVLGLLLTGMQKLTKRLPAGVYLLLMGCILVGDGMLLLGMIQLGKQFTMDFYEVITLVVPFYRFAVFLYPQPHVHAPFWLTPTVGATLGAAACVLAWSDDVSASASATFSFIWYSSFFRTCKCISQRKTLHRSR